MRLSDIRSLVNVEPPALSLADRLSKTCHSIDDARTLAAKRLPRSVFDYLEGGAEDEVSLRRNRSSFDEWFFVPRWGAIENLDLTTTILGRSSALPLILSPTGGTRLFHPDGEMAVARAALAAGIPYGLAHLSTTPMESISETVPGLRRWFNIEPISDKGELQDLLDRTANAGYDALLVNVDCRAIGHRERDYRNGFTAPPSLKARTVVEGALHPRWAWGFLRNDAIGFPNLDGTRPTGPMASTPDMWRTLLSGSYEPTDWDDIEDLRTRWSGPIVLKGCVSADDAAIAAGIGINAIQVSNHGGRQLDHMAAPLDVLPEIVERVGGRLEIIVDGGIRRGTDVVKSLALGADACAIGRPYLYGLAAAGQVGVAQVVRLFAEEIARTLMLLGVSTVKELRDSGTTLIRHRTPSTHRIDADTVSDRSSS